MLQFGRPTIEYICPYGHGRLNVEQVQIAGAEPARVEPPSAKTRGKSSVR